MPVLVAAIIAAHGKRPLTDQARKRGVFRWMRSLCQREPCNRIALSRLRNFCAGRTCGLSRHPLNWLGLEQHVIAVRIARCTVHGEHGGIGNLRIHCERCLGNDTVLLTVMNAVICSRFVNGG